MERDELTRRFGDLALGRSAEFDVVFDALWPLCLSFARRISASSDHEDVAQAALSKAFINIGRYRQGTDPVPWVITLVIYEARTARNRRARRREDDLIDVHTTESHEDEVATRERISAALEVLEHLTPADRAVLARVLDEEQPWGARERKQKQRAISRWRSLLRRLYV